MIDVVTQAIWRAMAPWPEQNGSHLWENQDEFTHRAFRLMAEAAVFALQLTEEQRTLADGMGGVMTQSRLVSPWTEVTS